MPRVVGAADDGLKLLSTLWTRLQALVGASPRTIARWRWWWRDVFATSRFWQAAAGRVGTPVARELLPLSLLERFAGDARERLVATLRFLGPITTAAAGDTLAV